MPELLHKLRHVDEFGKASVKPVTRAVRSELHRRHRLAKSRRPRVKVVHLKAFERCHLEVALHGEHLGYAVRYGRPRRKHDTSAAIRALDMADF